MGHCSSLPPFSSPHGYMLISMDSIRLVGLIPLSDKEFIYTLFVGLLVSIQLVTQLLDLYFNGNDLNAVAANLPTTGLAAVSLVRLIKLILNRETYYNLIQEVSIHIKIKVDFYVQFETNVLIIVNHGKFKAKHLK